MDAAEKAMEGLSEAVTDLFRVLQPITSLVPKPEQGENPVRAGVGSLTHRVDEIANRANQLANVIRDYPLDLR